MLSINYDGCNLWKLIKGFNGPEKSAKYLEKYAKNIGVLSDLHTMFRGTPRWCLFTKKLERYI
jgi:hypothetical protein